MELETESDEHRLVIQTLEPVNGDRKCFRMIGGVLVERTVQDVLPALRTNQSGIQTVRDGLVKEYEKKQQMFAKWKRDNHVQVVSQ